LLTTFSKKDFYYVSMVYFCII